MRTLFLVGTTLAKGWLTCRAWYEWITGSIAGFTRHMIQYFDDPTWYLLHSGIPVYAAHARGVPEAAWRMRGTELERMDVEWVAPHVTTWLSATICLPSRGGSVREEEMDTFLEQLVIQMAPTTKLTVHELYMIWCIHTQKWASTDRVRIRYFDAEGEEHTVPVSPSTDATRYVSCRRIECKKK